MISTLGMYLNLCLNNILTANEWVINKTEHSSIYIIHKMNA